MTSRETKQNKTNKVNTLEESPTASSDISPGEIIIGTLIEVNKQGQPLVDYSENPSEQSLVALTTLTMDQKQVGRQVALLFKNGDLNSPVIMGVIHSPLHEMLENFDQTGSTQETSVEIESDLSVDDVRIDGKKIVFDAKEEIVLKCGESSITLTKSGKILIRGKYLLNRSTGVNRIMGGSVQVN